MGPGRDAPRWPAARNIRLALTQADMTRRAQRATRRTAGTGKKRLTSLVALLIIACAKTG